MTRDISAGLFVGLVVGTAVAIAVMMALSPPTSQRPTSVVAVPPCECGVPLLLPGSGGKVRVAQVIYSDGSMMMPAYPEALK
ncbi:MAG: hypothetical protein WC876_11685 [Candidatus Thermoplasmatota archaeon]|jgi:hypothetical protein